MGHTDIQYADITALAPHDGPYPLYIRVRINNPESSHHKTIGEIEDWVADFHKYSVKIPKEPVAGFSLTNEYEHTLYSADFLEPLDRGLNSPFMCDIEGLKTFFRN
jgi:hypothetical protein